MSHLSHYKTSNDFTQGKTIPTSNLLKEPYYRQNTKDPPSLQMKWDTIQYVNSEKPEVWGPSFWFSLHNGAARYPINASPICAERMKGFILGIPFILPCEKCADHATAHIENNYRRLDDIVSGRQKLFNFFCDFHNYVNKRYNKPEMSYQDAYALYTGKTNVTKLTYGK